MVQVSGLGPTGSFTHQAALSYFQKNGTEITFLDAPVSQVPRKVRLGSTRGGADYGVLAVENLIYGFIDSTFDALYNTAQVQVIGEIYLPIRMKLISEAKSLKDITHIFSHQAALSQCRKTIQKTEQKYGVKYTLMPTPSTSMAVETIVGKPECAAIGSAKAAEKYQVPILELNVDDRNDQTNCHDREDNTTRFWVFGLGEPPQPQAENKTIFLVEIEPRAVDLRNLLNLFAERAVGETWIKPQIIPSKSRHHNWTHAYFIECEGHINDPNIREIYQILKSRRLPFLQHERGPRLIGSFPKGNHSTNLA